MSDMTGMTATEALPIWTLGDRLRKSRDEAGIKQEEMAQRLAKSRAAISAWEGDQHRPDTLAIRAWAHETGVPAWWIMGDNPTDPSVHAEYLSDECVTELLLAA